MKKFDLGDILSITTGKLLSSEGMGGIYKILNYMTDDNLFTHQLPRAADQCAPILLGLYPELRGEDPQITSEVELKDYLNIVYQEYGQYLEVPRLEEYKSIDPILELSSMLKEKNNA